MAIEKIKQQRTPGQFGPEATSLSSPDFGAASFVREGVVDKSGLVAGTGYGQAIAQAGRAATAAVEYGGQFYEGLQLARLEQEHEDNLEEFKASRNPAAFDQPEEDKQSLFSVDPNRATSSLWNQAGAIASETATMGSDTQYQTKVSTLQKAQRQGVISTDEFSQRTLAITREAINRTPWMADEIQAHAKKVLGFSGVEGVLKADESRARSAEDVYNKRVDFNMARMASLDIPVKYLSNGQYDLAHGEEEVAKAQKDKRTYEVYKQSNELLVQRNQAEASKFIEDNPNLPSVDMAESHRDVKGILNDPALNKNPLPHIRAVFLARRAAYLSRTAPIAHYPVVEKQRQAYDSLHEAQLKGYESQVNNEDMLAFSNNSTTIAKNAHYQEANRNVNPIIFERMSSFTNGPGFNLLLTKNPYQAEAVLKTVTNSFAGSINNPTTDYSVTMQDGKNAVAASSQYLAVAAGKGDANSQSVLNNAVDVVHADRMNPSKFKSDTARFQFDDKYIAEMASPEGKDGWKNLGDAQRGKVGEIIGSHTDLTMQGFEKDLVGIRNKGGVVTLSRLPDGRLNIQTNNPSDTSALISKYQVRFNNSIKALANVNGMTTQQASDILVSEYPALSSLVPEGEKKKSSPNYGNRADGTAKGTGFLGELQRPDGNISTELAVGINLGGKDMDIPLLVPTLTKKEIDTLLALPQDERAPKSIVDKAVAHAKERISQGKSPFASNAESPAKRVEGDGRPNATNPLNITIPGKPGKFQTFGSTEDGIKAASTQLDRYFTGKTPGTGTGLKTLDQIGGKWNNENEAGSTSKENYVETLVKNVGVDANTPLNLDDPSVKAKVIYAMSIAEGRPLTLSQIKLALGM